MRGSEQPKGRAWFNSTRGVGGHPWYPFGSLVCVNRFDLFFLDFSMLPDPGNQALIFTVFRRVGGADSFHSWCMWGVL